MMLSALVKAEDSVEISCNMVALSSSLSLKLVASRASFSRSWLTNPDSAPPPSNPRPISESESAYGQNVNGWLLEIIH